MVRLNYTTINHDARQRLGLSWHEYGLADLIYNLGNNPESPYRGWCYAKKEFLAEQLGISRRAVTTMISKLLEKGLIEKHPETKHLRITIDWYREVMIKTTERESREETSHSEKNLLSKREESSHLSEKKLPTTKINNNDINKTVNGAENIFKKLPTLPLPREQKEYLKDEILSLLKDRHSEKFYLLVASKIPENVIRQTLSEIKVDGANDPAKVFTYRMKKYALAQMGI